MSSEVFRQMHACSYKSQMLHFRHEGAFLWHAKLLPCYEFNGRSSSVEREIILGLQHTRIGFCAAIAHAGATLGHSSTVISSGMTKRSVVDDATAQPQFVHCDCTVLMLLSLT